MKRANHSDYERLITVFFTSFLVTVQFLQHRDECIQIDKVKIPTQKLQGQKGYCMCDNILQQKLTNYQQSLKCIIIPTVATLFCPQVLLFRTLCKYLHQLRLGEVVRLPLLSIPDMEVSHIAIKSQKKYTVSLHECVTLCV